jgi:hypothetical protein
MIRGSVIASGKWLHKYCTLPDWDVPINIDSLWSASKGDCKAASLRYFIECAKSAEAIAMNNSANVLLMGDFQDIHILNKARKYDGIFSVLPFKNFCRDIKALDNFLIKIINKSQVWATVTPIFDKAIAHNRMPPSFLITERIRYHPKILNHILRSKDIFDLLVARASILLGSFSSELLSLEKGNLALSNINLVANGKSTKLEGRAYKGNLDFRFTFSVSSELHNIPFQVVDEKETNYLLSPYWDQDHPKILLSAFRQFLTSIASEQEKKYRNMQIEILRIAIQLAKLYNLHDK